MTPRDEMTGQAEIIKAEEGETPQLEIDAPETLAAGFYEVHLTTSKGTDEQRSYAYNVDAAEGDLATIESEKLVSLVPDAQVLAATDIDDGVQNAAQSSVSEFLLYALVALLLLEQFLAYLFSYHPPALQGAAS